MDLLPEMILVVYQWCSLFEIVVDIYRIFSPFFWPTARHARLGVVSRDGFDRADGKEVTTAFCLFVVAVMNWGNLPIASCTKSVCDAFVQQHVVCWTFRYAWGVPTAARRCTLVEFFFLKASSAPFWEDAEGAL